MRTHPAQHRQGQIIDWLRSMLNPAHKEIVGTVRVKTQDSDHCRFDEVQPNPNPNSRTDGLKKNIFDVTRMHVMTHSKAKA